MRRDAATFGNFHHCGSSGRTSRASLQCGNVRQCSALRQFPPFWQRASMFGVAAISAILATLRQCPTLRQFPAFWQHASMFDVAAISGILATCVNVRRCGNFRHFGNMRRDWQCGNVRHCRGAINKPTTSSRALVRRVRGGHRVSLFGGTHYGVRVLWPTPFLAGGQPVS